MGLFDVFSRSVKCDFCGTEGAKKSGGRILCPNQSCPNFDVSMQKASAAAAPSPGGFSGGFSDVPAVEGKIAVKYRNHAGEYKVFQADPATLRRTRNHISACIEPSGQRVTLSRDRIQNLSEVEEACPQKVGRGQSWPSPREVQVLNYHKKHGSTSALYEQVRRKYPDW